MTYVVAAYDVDRACGGPEEGGWWYDVGELVRVLRVFRNEEKAYIYAQRLNRSLDPCGGLRPVIGPNVGTVSIDSVISTGRVRAMVHEDKAPEVFPDRRPHYE